MVGGLAGTLPVMPLSPYILISLDPTAAWKARHLPARLPVWACLPAPLRLIAGGAGVC